jgi:hypothetical protein
LIDSNDIKVDLLRSHMAQFQCRCPSIPFNHATEFFLRLKKNYQANEDGEVEESSRV